MGKEQLENRYKHLNIPKEEIKRMYALHLREQEMLQDMEAMANRNLMGTMGGAAAGMSAEWAYSALASLNSRYNEITNLVPDSYYFYDEPIPGTPICFTGINDGGEDMYDGANFMNTNRTAQWTNIDNGAISNSPNLKFASILYTHTQAQSRNDAEPYSDPPMNGAVQDGTIYFGVNSKYFTNMYPGLFVMIADNIAISEFNISGDIGADGEGASAASVDPVIPGWTLFYKTAGNTSDPSINHLILVPGGSAGITQEYDASSSYDDHRITGISNRSRIVYAVVAQPNGVQLPEADAILIAQKILQIISA